MPRNGSSGRVRGLRRQRCEGDKWGANRAGVPKGGTRQFQERAGDDAAQAGAHAARPGRCRGDETAELTHSRERPSPGTGRRPVALLSALPQTALLGEIDPLCAGTAEKDPPRRGEPPCRPQDQGSCPGLCRASGCKRAHSVLSRPTRRTTKSCLRHRSMRSRREKRSSCFRKADREALCETPLAATD